MDLSTVNAVNCVLTWTVVALSIVGYLVTHKRTGQRWSLFVVLATGWTLLAVPNSLLVIGVQADRSALTAIWLSSYLLVMASLLLLFMKLIEMMRQART